MAPGIILRSPSRSSKAVTSSVEGKYLSFCSSSSKVGGREYVNRSIVLETRSVITGGPSVSVYVEISVQFAPNVVVVAPRISVPEIMFQFSS